MVPQVPPARVATHILTFQCRLVLGLVQTEEYARAIIETGRLPSSTTWSPRADGAPVRPGAHGRRRALELLARLRDTARSADSAGLYFLTCCVWGS
ncbi:Scr1 family TA system antitoxin-like transcriptional regulator [Streptomyces syringium]|uniref:Scr1 family TA system antitoxin-like transcriptional regulator n=1 Tax=Streptomyces syringium TaxID=76729 RepID=UPI0034348B3B